MTYIILKEARFLAYFKINWQK